MKNLHLNGLPDMVIACDSRSYKKETDGPGSDRGKTPSEVIYE